MSNTRSVTKNDLDVLSKLVFDSYITQEVEFQGCHFVFRTLSTNEREAIVRKYRYLSNKYNLFLILEILSNCIVFVNGEEFVKKDHEYLLRLLDSRVVLKLYKFYQDINDQLEQASRFIDYYIETRDSRNSWFVFKTCSRMLDAFSIKKLNQYQYYWIVLNCFRDRSEEEKRQWSKVEYITNSICAFVNPKAFKKSKSQMNVSEQLSQNEDETKKKIVEQLETGSEYIEVETNNIFATLERMPGESEEQHEIRVNTIMEKTMNGEMIDEHDVIVRQNEINVFKSFLKDKRIKVTVERELYKRKGMSFDSTVLLENEESRKQVEEDKKKGFYFEDYSYLQIVRMRDFAAVPKKDKEKAFEEVMSETIDIEKELKSFLKSLSNNPNNDSDLSEGFEHNLEDHQQDNIDIKTSNDSEAQTDKQIHSVASRAAKMKVDVAGVDLLKNRDEKLKRTQDVMDRRKVLDQINEEILDQEDLDIMKFE
jgi:hypothetical protein